MQLNHASGTTNALPRQINLAAECYKLEPGVGQDTCPPQWWLAHPLVAMLAAKFLSSPATTVSCKQLFLVAGHILNILNKKHASLSPSNLDKLVCLHSWL